MIEDKFKNITVWKRGGERAPHKPLLVLYCLAKLLRDNQRMIPYEEIDRELRKLLFDFGPNRSSYRPEYPFWRLQKDSLWEVDYPQKLVLTKSGDVKKRELIEFKVKGGFKEDIYRKLKENTSVFKQIVQEILDDNFPSSIHEDILQAVGIDISVSGRKLKRDHLFRERILLAYEYRCAVCGFDVRIGYQPIALEAAHIKWHQAGGPDTETNGIALCALHHKLFDRGAFTLSDDMKIMVSDRANGSKGFKEWLMDFHGKTIKYPQRTTYVPHLDFTTWHVREVFQGKFREF
jgi:putative restriction endonuclease